MSATDSMTADRRATATTGAPSPSAARRGGPRAATRRRGQLRAALFFLAPGLIALVALRLVPAVSAVLDSFRSTNLTGDASSWVGLDNYRFLLSDPNFRQSVLVTLKFTVLIVPLQTVASLFLALLLSERFPGVGVIRTLVFVPIAAPAAVAAIVWGIALQPQGPVNAALEQTGLPAQPFLTSPDQALWALMLLLSWAGVGYWTIFLLAGLKDVPRQYYEAAALDGAGWWACLRHITLPNLLRPLAFVVVADTVASFLIFAPVQILTQGGPAGSTRLIMFEIYNQAYQVGDTNLAQAAVVLLMIVMFVITAVQFRLLTQDR
jgi:multiple sugar transport system permease protein